MLPKFVKKSIRTLNVEANQAYTHYHREICTPFCQRRKERPMGREATCNCTWARESALCKVSLETHELILRGLIRRRIPIASLSHVRAQGDQLLFRAGADEVALNLGANLAQSWAKKITTPPPTLAAKLGISKTIHLALIGEFESDEIRTAIAAAGATAGKHTDLILANVKTVADLNYTLDRYAAIAGNPPIWIVYPKGQGKPIGETEIRNTLRHEGFMDTKIASVSQTLTALRFIKRT
jgi:hypothetical protein